MIGGGDRRAAAMRGHPSAGKGGVAAGMIVRRAALAEAVDELDLLAGNLLTGALTTRAMVAEMERVAEQWRAVLDGPPR